MVELRRRSEQDLLDALVISGLFRDGPRTALLSRPSPSSPRDLPALAQALHVAPLPERGAGGMEEVPASSTAGSPLFVVGSSDAAGAALSAFSGRRDPSAFGRGRSFALLFPAGGELFVSGSRKLVFLRLLKKKP